MQRETLTHPATLFALAIAGALLLAAALAGMEWMMPGLTTALPGG
ncbi:MAG: hypothetical protein WBA25_14725 [Jannaschia sp.]